MLPTVTVDPSALWMIDENDGLDAGRNAIAAAMPWMSLRKLGPLDLFVSRHSINALTEAGAFPAEPRFAQVLDALGLAGVISPRTLATSVSRFIAAHDWVEEASNVRDLLISGVSAAPDPTIFIATNELRTVSLTALGVNAICAREHPQHRFVAFPRHAGEPMPCRTQAKIELLERLEGDFAEDEIADETLIVLGRPEDWPRQLSAQRIWDDADCATDLEVAIWIYASELERSSNCGLKAFRVGVDFLNTLIEHEACRGGSNSEAVLGKCANSILQKSSLRPQPFRTSARADAAVRVRVRDRANAWRQHVSKRHEALRLMYWELPSGDLEFSNLENKTEETISEGIELPARDW